MDLLVVFSTIQDKVRESPGQYSSLSTMEREEERMPGEKRKERLLLFQNAKIVQVSEYQRSSCHVSKNTEYCNYLSCKSSQEDILTSLIIYSPPTCDY